MLGGLTIYPPVANFLQCICAKNYENWLAVVKLQKLSALLFLAHPVFVDNGFGSVNSMGRTKVTLETKVIV